MRLVCLSDTHDRHERIVVPDGDVLVHAGDLTMNGTPAQIAGGFAWLARQPHERVVFVPGNHDFAFEREPAIVDDLARRFPRVEIVLDRAIDLDGYAFYGSPYQPWFHDWAFNFARGPEGTLEAREAWRRIPDDTQILVTHGPPRGVLDRVWDGRRAGCPELAERTRELERLRLFVCGHIHEAYGTERAGDVLYVNASSCTVKYQPTQPPIVVDLEPSGASVLSRAS